MENGKSGRRRKPLAAFVHKGGSQAQRTHSEPMQSTAEAVGVVQISHRIIFGSVKYRASGSYLNSKVQIPQPNATKKAMS
jgi:hypothetical protein